MAKAPSLLRVTSMAILAFWPLCFMLLVSIPVLFRSVGHALPVWVARWFPLLFPLGVVVGLVVFLRDLYTNDRVPPEKRTLWVALLLVVNPFSLPVYFWHYVRGQRPVSSGPVSPLAGPVMR